VTEEYIFTNNITLRKTTKVYDIKEGYVEATLERLLGCHVFLIRVESFKDHSTVAVWAADGEYYFAGDGFTELAAEAKKFSGSAPALLTLAKYVKDNAKDDDILRDFCE